MPCCVGLERGIGQVKVCANIRTFGAHQQAAEHTNDLVGWDMAVGPLLLQLAALYDHTMLMSSGLSLTGVALLAAVVECALPNVLLAQLHRGAAKRQVNLLLSKAHTAGIHDSAS